MQRFAKPEEYRNRSTGKAQFSPVTFNLDANWSGHYRRTLWLHAKNNFYYRDDPSKAAVLCKQLIERFALSEEAEEAKLLLHDVRIDIRKLVGPSDGKMPLGSRSVPLPPRRASEPAGGITVHPTRMPIAIAVVALPIVGIARGDIIGIAVPEIMAFAFLHSTLWTLSRIRGLVQGLFA